MFATRQNSYLTNKHAIGPPSFPYGDNRKVFSQGELKKNLPQSPRPIEPLIPPGPPPDRGGCPGGPRPIGIAPGIIVLQGKKREDAFFGKSNQARTRVPSPDLHHLHHSSFASPKNFFLLLFVRRRLGQGDLDVRTANLLSIQVFHCLYPSMGGCYSAAVIV